MAVSSNEDGGCGEDRIALGDHVIITGGGMKWLAAVHSGSRQRLGRSGVVQINKLAGLRFGEVVQYDPKNRVFVPSNAHPDLDITNVKQGTDELRDNRHLVDDNRSQNLSNVEIAILREEKGVDELLNCLVEKSTTFHTKTAYSQDKYLRRKKARYGTMFKLERVTPDGLAEIHLPTINPSYVEPEDTRWIRLRSDTMALILHHSGVHSGSRVLAYDKTNGYLEAALLSRLGDNGIVLQLMDKVAQPNIFPAQAMGLKRIKELWKAVPRNEGFLLGVEDAGEEEDKGEEGGEEEKEKMTIKSNGGKKKRLDESDSTSQWLRGIDARRMLMEQPADSLIVVDDVDAEAVITELLPFVALGGHIVVFSPFLEDLTGLFAKLWSECVNICVSETWYRHHQLLPDRTHPTVNMSTAGGYLLTAIKVDTTGSPRVPPEKLEFSLLVESKVTETEGEILRKRARFEEDKECKKGPAGN